MKKIQQIIVGVLAGLALASASTAIAYGGADRYAPIHGAYPVQPHPDHLATPRIDRRQTQQYRRIRQGVHSGALTRPEARRLLHQQAAIHRMERRAKADGIVTPHERRRLHTAQSRADRAIGRLKHDRQRY